MSIKKIAEIVGVSPSTVSRVLSSSEYRCSSEELRSRILETARKLNYVPNQAARNLKLGVETDSEIKYISVIFTRTAQANTDPFFSELLRMIEGEIHRNMFILNSVLYLPAFSDERLSRGVDADKLAAEAFSGAERKPDGIIIIGKCLPKIIKALKKKSRNIVSVNRNSTNYEIDEVLCDGRKIASMAVEYLISLGHRKIAYLGDCHNEARFKGYQETLFRYGLEQDIDFIYEIGQSEEQGYKTMEEILKGDNAPTGIYCANDIIAVGVLKCLNKYRNNYYMPSVISSDDIYEAQFTKPMLTTISLPKSEMAKFALFLLSDRMRGGHKAIVRTELECSLMIRSSCTKVENSMGCEYYI